MKNRRIQHSYWRKPCAIVALCVLVLTSAAQQKAAAQATLVEYGLLVDLIIAVCIGLEAPVRASRWRSSSSCC